MVTSTHSAYSIVENQAFREFVSYVSQEKAKLPTTKTLMSDLDTNYKTLKEKLKELIAKTKYLCLTADVWTNRAKSYLGVSIHFLDEVLERKSYLLALRRIQGRHTFEVLTETILAIQKEFNITRRKITHIVTDGASNFRKAFIIYGHVENSTAIEHNNRNVPTTSDQGTIQSVSDDSAPLELEDDTMFFPPDTVCESLNLNASDPTDCEDDDDECDEFAKLPKQMRCIAHTLNLVGTKDFESNLKNASSKCFDSLTSAYSKLKRFWELNSRSSVAYEIIERICNRSFPYPNATRWNSKFDAITIAEKHRNLIKDAIDGINREMVANSRAQKSKKIDQITSFEWKILKDYSLALKPVAIGLDILQGDKKSCQGYILPTLFGIKASLAENIEEKLFTSDYGTIMNECVAESIDSRFQSIMKFNEENKELILSASIHPNFKISWIERETDREYAQSLLINTYVKIANETKTHSASSTVEEDQTNNNSAENVFFKRLRQNEGRTSTDDSLTFDVWKYLLQPTNDQNLTQIRGIPLLEEIFRRYNTTLSSSASIERIFSKALDIFTPKRNRMSDSNFEKTLFIEINSDLAKA